MGFFDDYNKAKEERLKLGIPPLPLTKEQTKEVCELLKSSASAELVDLLANRVNPGVDEAAKVKAEFLNEIINHGLNCSLISKVDAVKMLEPMLGGYSVIVLVATLRSSDESVAKAAADVLKNTIFVHDYFNDVAHLAKEGNKFAAEVIKSWANAEWFKSRDDIPEKIEAIVFKVPGETNTDDLSPASEAFSRSDIPLHANAMLMKRQPGSLEKIAELKKSGREVVYVGDVVGTGSSRKSGINSIQWHIGREIPGIPNKKTGGVILGSIIAPIFFNTAEDSGALPIIVNVDGLETGDEIEIYPYKGEIVKDGKVIKTFKLEPNTLKDEVKAGGRIPLIIARSLCAKARAELNLGSEDIFTKPAQPASDDSAGYTLAQKMVGRACGLDGVRPGMYVEPITLTVGSQDTTGPMTRDEIKELASLGFSADFVLQSFCHTAAYPKPTDALMHKTLPDFMISRGGVSLKPGDGVIHSWLNRMVLPDSVGTGGDSHTRFPIGISFPAGSGLVAFAAVLGSMPLNMPESVLVRFSGKMQPGITLRDLVNAIPYYAIKKGLLTVEKKGKVNVFAGKVLEIEGLPDLKVEQAFELSDASAERSAAACAIALNKEPVIEYLKSNITLIDAMIEAGYGSDKTLARRRDKMKKWLENPELLQADKNAKYHTIIEINMDEITEPILACPNDPDDVATLSEILADPKRPKNIDEVFVGSCMTNIGHYRALSEVLKGEGQVPTRLWVVPPTKMDEAQLRAEGRYSLFGAAGARTEVPGCSLCMGNQARVADNAIVFSTSTRNFDNRMGMGAKVYLGSAELAAVCAMLGRLPSVEEYMKIVPAKLAGKEAEIYKYLNFNLVPNFKLECF
ncbi:bifunctional aconitate hydratase 2/2-methylisocitrate dehydratase [Campylobacter hyointestinalis]|uniref:Aconitate hydratase B n=4 Tax=Campylobacter hyointestinalis TaxID=198 RepID=A0AAV6EFN0_CAMHY|nr:bifunctional aconitate hydratase 2/2-methylisocitrate dehydratase [Campylobacter hyointestinalis]KAB0612854.1 bifunctional aconitate hydratase 2/2-methylisocitrate dehydratase [Campylobacter hyointestinalis subsp. lawsonii]QKF69526.1 aconitate hydratase 2 [Campylobacter hyointestinalis subsp. lawsonii]RAZ29149.1 bifunctional aconitate hydratase 2/2-methylisocitrate dehydratase [Campylobacter hyointestinalis subsp. lawsonii]